MTFRGSAFCLDRKSLNSLLICVMCKTVEQKNQPSVKCRTASQGYPDFWHGKELVLKLMFVNVNVVLSWVLRIKSNWQYKMMIQVILQILDLVCCIYCIVLSSTYISAAMTQWSDLSIDHFCSIKRLKYCFLCSIKRLKYWLVSIVRRLKYWLMLFY